MKVKYFVQTLYEGKCPSCGQYQNGTFPEWVDKECSKCKHDKVIKALLKKPIIINRIDFEELDGPHRFHIKSGGKKYMIFAKDFQEIV